MNIIVDAMGGDNAPRDIVLGSMGAIRDRDGFNIILLGDRDKIEGILGEEYSGRISVIHADEVITNDDMPVKAVKDKKNSSMVLGIRMLNEGKGDVFISAGNTGALLAASTLILGRIRGIDRPALAPVIPTRKGGTLLIDAGFNTQVKPINYLQFGVMGTIYMREMFNIENPRVGLINVGVEETKGNDMVKQAFTILSQSDLNFVGNVEGRSIPLGEVDVAVCDGFLGNVLLKFLEGVGVFVYDGLKKIYFKNILSKFAALLVRGELKNFRNTMDYESYGGVPVLGIKGNVFKCHGSSNAKSFKNALIKAYAFANSSVSEQIKLKLSEN